jgi:hypothetical protein
MAHGEIATGEPASPASGDLASPGCARRFRITMEEYEIRVRGRVSPAMLARFEGMRSQVEPVETVLHGPLPDQAALHGMIALIRSLGLELVEVRKSPGSRATR